jgi:dolichol-phosphate mannosyltransferase
MKNGTMRLTIVIPARNEEESLPGTLRGLEANVKTPHEIIVVDDHSTDSTAKIVHDFGDQHQNISLLKNNSPGGITNAIKKGLSNINEGIVVFVMADSCDDPETIDKMYEKINEGYDVVCGSRYMKGGKKQGGRFFQTLFSKFVGYSLHFFTGLPTCDAGNAFKMYRVKPLRSIKIKEAGFASSLEIVVKLFKKGYKITEIPTTWKDRLTGRSNFRIFKVTMNYIRWYVWALFA